MHSILKSCRKEVTVGLSDPHPCCLIMPKKRYKNIRKVKAWWTSVSWISQTSILKSKILTSTQSWFHFPERTYLYPYSLKSSSVNSIVLKIDIRRALSVVSDKNIGSFDVLDIKAVSVSRRHSNSFSNVCKNWKLSSIVLKNEF